MNGDCLFSCVLIHLNMVFEQNHDICLIEQLHSMGVNKTNVGISVIRDLMVDEWIMNSQEYRPFLKDDLEFETEADKYRTNGVYSTDLGDVMLLGLNNALHLQLIVFTSVPNCPYLTVSPRCPVASREPLCLAYIQAGSGHYNLAVRSLDDGSCSSDTEMQSTDEPKKTTNARCRCGRGRNAHDSGRVNCTNSNHYSCRCPCLKEKLTCTSECKCLNCDNGNKQSENLKCDAPLQRKKRPRHTEQEFVKKRGGSL